LAKAGTSARQPPDETWRERWASRICTPAEAVRRIPAGRRILIGSGAAEPRDLVEALVSHGQHLSDNDVVHLLTLGSAPYVQPGLEQRFRHTAFFIGPNVRRAIHEGRADFMPVFLSEIPELIRSRRVRVDVALIQVSPPDRHGHVSLGVSVDIVRAAVESADLVLAEINPRMPRTLGDSFLHVDRIARLVPVAYELPEPAGPEPDEIAHRIGRHVAELIPDGATLQAGIGAIPEAVLSALGERRDLGIHTEMLSDGMMRLAEQGVVTGARKTLLRGKIVTSFVMGSRGLYDWVDDNALIEMRPSNFTNDPLTIARNERMISVNSALAVDLTGQVASDTLLGRFFSGIGGQVDFIRGATRSRGGKAIIAMRSTADGGRTSRIQAAFEAGAGVVTSRGDVHYVVTEYGVADLWGKNVRQRAMSLIEIAHPDCRGELLADAKRRRYVFADQVVPRGAYPWEESRSHRLRDGRSIVVRPARLTDEETLRDLFYRLSDESTYRRFLSYRNRHPHREMQYLVDLDYGQSMALVACTAAVEPAEILAIVRYDVDPATNLADIAFVVRDDWQHRGIGSLLLQRAAEIARAHGLAGFTADVLASNHPMMSVFQKSGLALEMKLEAGAYHLVLRFDHAEASAV
jgi:acyl-CoA hydrolase/GNAT superfamily N-acetyltransferase